MRFITAICVLAALGFGAVYSLATFVTPHTREITVTIPAARLKPQPAEAAAIHQRTAGTEAAADSATTTR